MKSYRGIGGAMLFLVTLPDCRSSSLSCFCRYALIRKIATKNTTAALNTTILGHTDADSQIRFLTFQTFIGDADIGNRRERTLTYTELTHCRHRVRINMLGIQVGREIPPRSRHLLDAYWTQGQGYSWFLLNLLLGEVVTVSCE